ncbi:hypothetical protein [Saccharopolyspora taberi]|uniref:Uncharacterized protein n=1 Tax=Saccharopolyspora taberi TaxID=60895 RepID=A0ABN3VLD8_9PSEU
MSHFAYEQSQQAARDYDFDTLVMAAIRRADSTNAEILWRVFPEIADELQQRYDAPGGFLPGEAGVR